MAANPFESLVDQISITTRNFLTEIMKEWTTMYSLDENLKKNYAREVVQHVQKLYDDIIVSEREKKRNMIAEIEKCLVEHSILKRDLQLTVEIPVRDDDPLQTVLQALKDDMKLWREMRDERLKRLEDLLRKGGELCELLGVEPLTITSTIPSHNDLHYLDHHIRGLHETKIERTNMLMVSRERLVDMMRRLEIGPSNAFEQQLTEGDLASIRLTEENMRKVKDTLVKYEDLVTEATERVNQLQSKLEKLWKKIPLTYEERVTFNASYGGIANSAVNALTHEIERCEMLNRANLKPAIEMVRKEIANLWDMMGYTAEARRYFSAYFTDTLTEDVLELHEMEQSRLQQIFDKYEVIFNMAAKRDLLVAQLEEFAASAKDPNRYKNRRCLLLREERKRKAIETSLQKNEAQLMRLLPEYENENNRSFLWRGEDLLAAMNGKIRPSSRQALPSTSETRSRSQRFYFSVRMLCCPMSVVNGSIINHLALLCIHDGMA